MLTGDLTNLALIVGFLLQFGAAVWWASRLTTLLGELKTVAIETKDDLKEHVEQDTKFQMDVVRQLGGISPSIPPRNGRSSH